MANSNSTHTQPLLQLSGYTLLEQIYRGTKTIVYRAVQAETQRPVIIKVLHRDYPSFSELVQFRNQYTVTKNLPIPGIVQPLSLESLGNSYALVMEDLGCISLGQYLQQQPLSLTETLAIAIQLAEILHHLHQHRVIHKDIKPANILIHPDSKQVQPETVIPSDIEQHVRHTLKTLSSYAIEKLIDLPITQDPTAIAAGRIMTSLVPSIHHAHPLLFPIAACEEALSNELAAKFYLHWGKEKVAAGYMQEAYYCYAKWGAKAKVVDLETRYPDLLRPILQQAQASVSILSNLATLSTSPVSSYTSNCHSSSSAQINQSLDFATILKASQALSSTIQFDELLDQLTQIILQNSGADHCALILPSDTKEWQVRARATPNETQLCTEPLTNNPHIPVKLIQYVKNTQEVVVIDNMETTLPVIGDYLRQQQPKSVLCLPLLHQGHLIGILYLKNRLTRGVFTEDRILILNFLCTQAAISLENARLYQQLEHSLQDAQQKSQDLAEVLALSNGQQQILALIAQGVSLNTILAETARFIESHTHHPAYCSFLLIDAEGRLRHGAAPSLPAAYNALIDGIKIGPAVGSCGTAAYCKASVTVTDIATDPVWANYRVALDFGLRACTSTPILGAEGQVLATLAMYQPVAGEFTLHDRKLMEVSTYLARIAIERHQADIELQNTQLQIVQSEKMASLGNLVAGVAHEINNPIGFLNGSINNAKDYVQDLLDYIAVYQQHHPQAATAVQDKAEEIDLEFLTQDLPKLLDSMEGATNRITGISTSLRTFSRADTEHKISVNLHDGINSTLLILKYRLKANEFRPAIAVIQNYGDLPEIKCFPGQLNQVFMNILANAIDMFDEMAQTLSFEAIKANPQEITIHTQQVGEQVQISIRDNGQGISQEVQEKIFDHLFTTKSVGKGTGLGLAIARQIVVEKHGARLEVHSQLGKGSEFCIYLPICS